MSKFVDVVKSSEPLDYRAEVMGVGSLLPLLLVYVKGDQPISQESCNLIVKYLNVLHPGLSSKVASDGIDFDDSIILDILLELSHIVGDHMDMCLQTCVDICSQPDSDSFVCSRCIYLMPFFLKVKESVGAGTIQTESRQIVRQIILDASSEKENDSLKKTQALYALYLLFNEFD